MSGGMDAYFERAAPMMAAVLGSETVELRQPLTLRGVDSATSTALVAAAPAAPGDTLLLVASPTGGLLRGDVPANLSFAVGATAAATTAAASAGAQPAATLSLQVSPLPAAVDAGDALVLDAYASTYPQHCIVHGSHEMLVDEKTELAGDVSFAVSLPHVTTPAQPRMGDLIVTSKGTGVVLGVPGDGGGSYEVLAGRPKGGASGWGVGG